MKVQKKVKETKVVQNSENESMSLCDVKKVLYGLTPVFCTYKGSVVVDVPNTQCCYLRIDPYKTNHRSSRYSFKEVYALRDCLIQLSGSSRFNTSYDMTAYFIERYVISFERDERKDNRRKLTDLLKPLLDKTNCCLIDEVSKVDSFGIRIAERMTASVA
jgi:hypothetical protein